MIKRTDSSTHYYQHSSPPPRQNIKVVVRVRPPLDSELKGKASSICLHPEDNHKITLVAPSRSNPQEQMAKEFYFDRVFPANTTQQQLYSKTCFGLVESAVQGYYSTLLAYGQTGSGKTYTICGQNHTPSKYGMIPRAFSHFLSIAEASDTSIKSIIKISFLQIYNQQIRDLLSSGEPQSRELKQSPEIGVFVKDLCVYPVSTMQEFNQYYAKGLHRRATFATKMNSHSSRSHSILTVYMQVMEDGPAGGKPIFREGKINLVDLAGSERQKKSESVGMRFKEAVKINLSLIALSNVITALVDGKKNSHVPYRDSKLTRILQDSFGGATKATLIANVSPVEYNHDETLSTLRYASRASLIKNTPIIHIDPKDMLIKQYLAEIKRLRQLCQQSEEQLKNSIPMSHQQMKRLRSQIQGKYRNELDKKNAERNRLLNQKNEMGVALREEQRNNELLRFRLAEFEGVVNHYKPGAALSSFNQNRKDELRRYQQQEREITESRRIHMKEEYELDFESETQDAADAKKPRTLSLQQQIEKLTRQNKKLKKKLYSAKIDNQDLNQEFQEEREYYLEMIRELQKEEAYYYAVCLKMLTVDELGIIRSNSEYNQDRKQYKVAPFMLRKDKLHFPKILSDYQIEDMIAQEKNERKLILQTVLSRRKSPGMQLDSRVFRSRIPDKTAKTPQSNGTKDTMLKSKLFDNQDILEEEATDHYEKKAYQQAHNPSSEYYNQRHEDLMRVSSPAERILKEHDSRVDRMTASSKTSIKNQRIMNRKMQSPYAADSTPELRKASTSPGNRRLVPLVPLKRIATEKHI